MVLWQKKKKTAAEELKELVEDCAERYTRWHTLRTEGGSDPFWSDGVNLNLLRNHIKYAKHQINEHCAKHGLVIPAIYYRPMPPEMPNDFYVVTGKHYQRRMELKRRIDGTAKAEDTVQLSLF